MHPRLARLAMHLRPRTWIPLSAPRRDAWALVCTVSPGNGLDSFLPVRHYRGRRLTVKETTLSPRLPDACLYKTVLAHSYQSAEIPFRVMTTDFTCPGLERLTRVIAVGMREQCARSRRPVRSLPSRGGRGGASARLECIRISQLPTTRDRRLSNPVHPSRRSSSAAITRAWLCSASRAPKTRVTGPRRASSASASSTFAWSFSASVRTSSLWSGSEVLDSKPGGPQVEDLSGRALATRRREGHGSGQLARPDAAAEPRT